MRRQAWRRDHGDGAGARSNLAAVGAGLRCTPQSIAAHGLYENAHPYLHKECSGTLDLTHSKYTAIDAVSVRITGSGFIPSSDYTVKLEVRNWSATSPS